ncbi:3-ketoacyl-CoA thiolase 1, peroxisomal-like [Arachis hypogaea]|uniref:3-ketoacyl-CoA thiolase 1, peroxisomal-like n=1 Tax=Arachis hypogaea TaxID=3818 RepID=UPI000DED43DC|nr:3-ketoacyl-CoA thiolase 1, peroxisomal-like [Arachis hypogaea]
MINFTASFEEDQQQFQCHDTEGQGILSSFEYLYSPLALFGKKKAAPPPPSKKAAAAVTPANDELAKWYVSTKIVDPKTREEKQIIVSADDSIQPNSTLMDLTKLKPAFQKDSSTTAGNASQVSDGAAAVLLMKRRVAMQKGLSIIGTFRSFATVRVDPAIIGVGLAFAIPAAVKSTGLELHDIDLFEINEVLVLLVENANLFAIYFIMSVPC